MNSSGREVRTLMRNPPRASSSTSTSGSAASISARHRGSMKWSMRNCPTPRRSHPFQASSGSSTGSVASRSSTVTSCPSFASSIAKERPFMPAPSTRIVAITPPSRSPSTSGGYYQIGAKRFTSEDRILLALRVIRYEPSPAIRIATARALRASSLTTSPRSPLRCDVTYPSRTQKTPRPAITASVSTRATAEIAWDA